VSSRVFSPLTSTTRSVDPCCALYAVGVTTSCSSDWNAIRRPSGDHAGFDPAGATWRGTPPRDGITQIPPRPEE